MADMLADVEPGFRIDHYATDRFGERARDAEWLNRRIADSPSGNF